MRGEPGALYDAHAERLYAYCWSLVGDDAPAAVRDTFTAAVQHPPRGDAVLWLYALARTACARRGGDRAFGQRIPDRADPLLRAAAGLRADQREVLVLSAGEWLEPPDIARVLGIAPDTTRQMLHLASTRLERAVLDNLLHGVPDPRYGDVITAFEKGRLPHLLARRAPARPPAALRARVLAAYEAEATSPLPTVASPAPLVVINPAASRDRGRPGRSGRPAQPGRPRRGKVAGGVAGLAAASAATVGLLAAWSGQHGDGGGDRVEAAAPTTEQRGPDPSKARTTTTAGGQAPRPSASTTDPFDPYAPRTPDSTQSPAPSTSAPATKSDPAKRDTEPAQRARTRDPNESPTHPRRPTSPPSRGDAEPPPPPTTEPEPTEPEPTETADPTPTPTGNPTPSPTDS